MLDRVPGATFCSRFDPATQKFTWLYVSGRASEVYDVDAADLLADPGLAIDRTIPEDRPRLDAALAACIQNGTPMSHVGRIRHRSGEIRWIETHAEVERQADGTVLWFGQSFDVTERRKSEALYRQVVDALPLGIMVADQDLAFPIFNPTMTRLTGGLRDHTRDITGAYGVFKEDGVTPLSMTESGTVRALAGETLEEEVVIKNPRLAAPVRMHVTFCPLRDEAGEVFAALGVCRDITVEHALEADLRVRSQELADSEAQKAGLRSSIEELSTPILEVWDGVLVMPIIGIVDSRRASDMVQRLLAEVTRMQAAFVIIDLTGVELVDTHTADHLIKLVRKVEVVGARCVLTGVRAAVAETLGDIGVDFGRLVTLRNLKHGLLAALRAARRDREGLGDLDLEAAHALDPKRSASTR
jgi:rsbT co-antagonist protein RsbR